MQKIITITDLKGAIQQLEFEQAAELVLLKEQLLYTCESLKPINLIKSTLKEAYSAPDFKTNIVKTIIGIASGFVAKKVFIGKTHNPIKKLAGFILEMVVASKMV
jgi:hypothetical protein